jgi:hypothetical protein
VHAHAGHDPPAGAITSIPLTFLRQAFKCTAAERYPSADLAGREDRSHPLPLTREPRVPDRVDTTMDPVQPACPHTPGHATSRQADREQLQEVIVPCWWPAISAIRASIGGVLQLEGRYAALDCVTPEPSPATVRGTTRVRNKSVPHCKEPGTGCAPLASEDHDPPRARPRDLPAAAGDHRAAQPWLADLVRRP